MESRKMDRRKKLRDSRCQFPRNAKMTCTPRYLLPRSDKPRVDPGDEIVPSLVEFERFSFYAFRDYPAAYAA